MKRNIIIALILVGTVLLSACNALEQPEASKSEGSADAAAADSFIPEKTSEYEKIGDEVSKLTDISIKTKYKPTLDKFKFTHDFNYHYAEIKSEINDEIAKKQSASTKRLKKASGKNVSLAYVKTDKAGILAYNPVDHYVDDENQMIHHLFDNITGKYMGTMRFDDEYCINRTITDEEEFKSKALDFLKENFDLGDYEFLSDKVFYESSFTHEVIESYRLTYAKTFYGIPSAEKVQCIVWADGVITYNKFNEGMFDNVEVPEIDLKDILPLAVEKAECVLENIPESCELAGFGMKNHEFYVDSSGHLMLTFRFQYTLYTPHPERPWTYTEGIPMAIVID